MYLGGAVGSRRGAAFVPPRHTLRLVVLLSLVGPLVAFATIHPARAAGPTGADEQDTLEVVSATVHDPGGFTALFGAGVDRTLQLTVRNTSDESTKAIVTARWGRGPSRMTAIPSSLVEIRPAETVTIEMPFRVDAMTVGKLTVEGEITSTDETSEFSTETSQWPWGLAVIGIAVVALAWYLSRPAAWTEEAFLRVRYPRATSTSPGRAAVRTEGGPPAGGEACTATGRRPRSRAGPGA